MVQRFIDYSAENGLLTTNSNIVVAVSGGIDSMVLASLFLESGIRPAIAHCNFSLRGSESDGDEGFVRDFTRRHSLPFHTVRFDTTEYATEKRISIQMAARELRYNWFEEIRVSHGYDDVAVAHNLNDSVETFFINLLRGTGLNGLTGINPRNGHIIRPLLFATREEIVAFADSHGIHHREDSSNASVKYLRNRIRHRIMPLLMEANPDVLFSIATTMKHLNGSSEIVAASVDSLRARLFKDCQAGITVSIEHLAALRPAEGYLFELFRPFGLTSGQTGELLELMSGTSGKMLVTSGHRILKDRDYLIITEPENTFVSPVVFRSFSELSCSPLFSSVTIEEAEAVRPFGDPGTAFIDAGLIHYPLTYRHWEPGDRFIPLGMTGMKKISDFLIDSKVPRSSKEKVMVLASDNDIIWVAGYRPDNRFRVTDETTSVLIISL